MKNIILYIIILLSLTFCINPYYKLDEVHNYTIYIPRGYDNKNHNIISPCGGEDMYFYPDSSTFYFNYLNTFTPPNKENIFSNKKNAKSQKSLLYHIAKKESYDFKDIDSNNLYWREYFTGDVFIGYQNVSLSNLEKFDEAIEKFKKNNEDKIKKMD